LKIESSSLFGNTLNLQSFDIQEGTIGTSIETRLPNPAIFRYERSLTRLKTVIWIYFFLLIFEGAVRKWIPPLSVPFLIVRDPLAFYIWIVGVRLRIGKRTAWQYFNIYALIISVLGLLQIISTTISPLIIMYGWRSYVLHIPVIIVLAGILDEADIRLIGKWVLITAIPMAVLMVLQYMAPATSFLNKGASDMAGQISGALGHVRPAGTFSFITGPINFFPIVTAICIWGLIRSDLFPRWLVFAASIANLFVIPVSISRTIAITTGLMIFAAFLGAVIRGGMEFKPRRLPQVGIVLVFSALVIVGLAQVPLVQDAVNTFTTRWTQAQGSTGDNSALEARTISIFTEVLDPISKTSIIGEGIGAGSAVATSLRGEEGEQFEYGENPAQRQIYELGSWIGPVFVLGRFGFSLLLILASFRSLYQGSILPWLLMVPASIDLVIGGLDQTTVQGFSVVVLGIWLATARLAHRVEV
jgi:hypothetical protein